MVSGQTGDRGQDVDGVKSLRKGKEVAQILLRLMGAQHVLDHQ